MTWKGWLAVPTWVVGIDLCAHDTFVTGFLGCIVVWFALALTLDAARARR